MEDPSKNIMCSVLFLDIVGYSKKSIAGEMSLKNRFNAFLSAAIHDVPLEDRIILDTGDGAALSFIGDIGDALQVALTLCESFQSEVTHMELPLQVRMGINLGPVRLVKDINGQLNIIGDGINVAQRVMGFSEPGQILVTRSYYEAVSQLSPEYDGMFFYLGSRTDKHVREHEIYATGYSGGLTGEPQSAGDAAQKTGKLNTLLEYLRASWQFAAQQLATDARAPAAAFREASPKKRAVYLGALAVPLVVFALLAIKPVQRDPVQHPAVVEKNPDVAVKEPEVGIKGIQIPDEAAKKPEVKEKGIKANIKPNLSEVKPANKKSKMGGFLSVSCKSGNQVFVDGGSAHANFPLSIQLNPGDHLVLIIHGNQSIVYTKTVHIKTGKTVRMRPDYCN